MNNTYLSTKLKALGIDSLAALHKYNCVEVFKWLKQHNQSLANNALFDLYCIYHNLEFNSLTIKQKTQLLNLYEALPPSYVPYSDELIEYFIQQAQKYAHKAQTLDEIPIGAIIIKDQQIIGYGYNQVISKNNLTKHAEINAITMAQKHLGNYRLNNCDLFVTIEPCLMCSGAIIQSRIRQVYYGATEPKTGAVTSQYQVFNNLKVNHHTQVIGPVDQKRYAKLVKEFLADKR